MRHTICALLSMLLAVGCCHHAFAESSGWRLWPFGAKDEPTATTTMPTTTAPAYTPSPGLPPSSAITPIGPETSSTPSTASRFQSQTQVSASPTPNYTDPSTTSESRFANFKWPTMKMPEWPRLRPESSQQNPDLAQDERPRNAWVEQPPERPKPTPIQSLSNGARRAGERTRAAWHKTVDVLTPGEPDPRTPPRLAERNAQQPFWKRMFGAKEEEPQGPQTIQGFIAQERLDP